MARSIVMSRLRRTVGGFAALTVLVLGGKACSDLTAPAGVNDVSVQFRLAPAQTRLDLIVGDSIRPDVVVMLGGTETSRARYVFTSSDPDVIRVYANGDSIVAEDRGTATLVVTLVGTTIGNNRVNPSSRTADTIVVAAAALSNVVSPTTVNFQSLGARQTVVARSLGRNNKVISGTSIEWRSTAPGVVSVTAIDDSTAELTSIGNGAGASVYAVFGGVDSTSTAVTVSQQLKRYILTTASSPNLRSLNETMSVSARAVDSLNNTIDVAGGAPAPAVPAFQSDNPGKVEINATSGVMTAIGNTTEPVKITATVGGAVRSDTLPVTVTQFAASLTIQADTIRLLSIGDKSPNINVLAPDALGTQVPSGSIRWTPDDPSVVQVEGQVPATFTALATGTTVVRARADQQVDSVVVIVTNDPAFVTISPKPLQLRSLNESRTLAATVTNSAGTALPGAAVTWASRDSAVVEPQATPGVVIARSTGETYLVASTTNGRADSAFVRVTNAPDTVNIVPADITLASTGDTDGTFGVELRNALGASLPRTAANWSSHDVTVARAVDGVITAAGPGVTYIVAVSPENADRRDSVRVTVTNAPASVVVTPDPAATLTFLGATTAFTAVVRNQAGAVIQNAPVTWSVQSGSSVSINAATGLATATGNGTSTVRATAGSVVDDVTLTVAQAISTSRSTITPAATSLTANGASATAVTVQLKDAADSLITSGGAAVTLALSPAIATLSAVADNGDGTFTATLTAGTTSGSVTISGTVNGATMSQTGVVNLTAAAASQYVLSVSPNLQPVAGSAVAVAARLADANGNTVATAGNVVAWTSTGGGSFSAGTSTTDATGVATVTFTTSSTATTHAVTATTGSITGTSQPITPTAGAATHYGVTPSSTSPVAGSTISVSAQLLDANDNAVRLAGQTVTWTKSDANGSFSAATSLTDASGAATVALTTHTVAGTATTVTATTGGLTGTSAVATTVPAGASQLLVAQLPSATPQSGVAFTQQPTVQLRDAFGNNVATTNIAVTATLASGGGTLGGTATVLTDAGGLAAFTDLSISGAVGAKTLGFTASGIGSTSAGVTLVAGPAAQIAVQAGNGQSATVGSSVATAPAAIVRDASGNPVGGVDVTFTLTGGGSITPASPAVVATDAGGIAALTSWTLGQTSGTNNNVVTASVAGLTGSPVTFTASGTPDAAQTVVANSALTQNAVVGSNVSAPPSVVVHDQFGNAVGAGVPVTFTLTANGGGGGAITPVSVATVNTSAAGVATLTSWTLGNTAGAPNTVDATVGGNTVTFTGTGTSASAQSIVANSVTTQSAVVGTMAAAPPSVLVRDASNNPVASFPVTFTILSSGGTGGAIDPGSPATVLTDASGIATLTSWTLGQSTGTNNNTVTASGSGLPTIGFNASGTPGPAASLVANSATTQSATVGTPVAAAPSVVVRDAFGNAVGAGVDVTFALAATGGAGGAIDPVSVATVATNASGVASLSSWTLGQTAGTNNNVVTATIPTLNTVTFNASGTAAAATTIAAQSVTSQSAPVATAVPAPPSVLVTDANGNPVAGIAITFTLTASGGPGGAIGPVSPAVVSTSASGIATLTSWTLGQTAGVSNNTVTVTGAGLATLTFNASGIAGAAQNMIANSTLAQSATVGTAPASLPSVMVRDAFNNPVAGTDVTFTLSATGGAGGAITPPAPVTTNAAGIATLSSWTLGQATGTNNNVVTAAVNGLTGSPVTFTASGAPDAPAALVANSATAQSATVGTTVAAPPSVVVRDQFGNAVGAGVNVTFTLTATGGAGGAISPASIATVPTSASGVAALTSWTLGQTAGTSNNTVTATIPTLNTVTFNASGSAGSASSIAATSATSQSATVGTAVTAPTVIVRDANSNPVAGVSITFTVTATGGTGGAILPASPATVLTDASGVAALTGWTLGQTAGTNNNTVTATGAGLPTIVFNASGTPGAAAGLVANSATAQSAAVGTTVAAPPSVVVRDAFGNAVGAGVDVTFTLTASGGAGGAIDPASVATVATSASGVASLTSWTLGQTAGSGNNTVTATIPTLNTVTFTASGTAGTATTIAAQSATAQSATVATSVSAPPSVLVTDASGNPVAGVTVTFTLTAPGGAGGAIGPVSPATVLTNASGVATLASWTLGQSAGTDNNTVTATAAGLATITFNASGTAGSAQNMIANSVTSQSAVVASAATAPSVIVRDAFNNPVAGTTVTFTLTSSGGTGGAINPLSPAGMLTDASGVATLASWTLGQTAGSANNVVSAAVAGLTGSPVAFTASGTADVAASLVANSATSQSATVGSAASAPPSVVVRDQFGNAVGAGVDVTFTLAASGGAGGAIAPATPATVATNGAGVATLTSWTMGQTAGANNNTVTATIPALNTVTFTASGTAGTATQLAITTQPSATATAGIPFAQQPALELRDTFGNVVTSNNSTVVTATRSAGTGTLQGTLSTTAVNGVATFGNLAHSAASTITILFTAPGLTSATSDNIVVGGGTKYLVTAARATVAAGDTVTVVAQLADAGDNPVAIAGKTVNWSRSGLGGAFPGGSTTSTSLTDASGRAEIIFTVHTVATTVHTVTATDNTLLTGTSGNVTVVAAAPSQLAFVVDPTDAEANAAIAPAVEVEVRDAFGNPVLADPDAGATETITLAFTTGTNTEGATLSATLPQAINWASGRATFADVSADLPGSYQLSATEGAFSMAVTDANSAAFSILSTTAAITASSNTDETTWNDGTLTVQITNGTFAAAPGAGDFSLAGAPAGTTISGVTRNSDTEVVLDIDFDGTDFDVDATVSVNVLTSALATGVAATTGNSVTVTPAAATTVVLTGPADVTVNVVSGAFTLEAREANGTSMTLTANVLFDLAEDVVAGTQEFFSDGGGASLITQVTIANGTATATFHYRDTEAGTANITATWNSGGSNLGSGAHPITVNP